LSKERRTQIVHLIEEKKACVDTIDQLRFETNNIITTHAKQLAILQEEKKEMSQNHEEKINVLVAQIKN
jgi:hypothetical protein